MQLVDKNVGGDQVLATAKTAADGGYTFSDVAISAGYLARYHKTSPDLQVQALVSGSVAAASAVAYSASTAVGLDLVLPADAVGLPSEYELLTANLAAAYPGPLGRAAGG